MAGLSFVISLVVAFFFYDSGYGLVVVFPVGIIIYVWDLQRIQKNRKMQIKREFREVLMSISNGLSAGSSVENTFVEAEHNIRMLYGKESVMQPELFRMNQRVQMGTAIEKQFALVAKKYGVEEIKTFSELFIYAKKMGGNYTQNIRSLALRIDEKIGMKEELEAQMAEKMLELRIMAVMPLGILAYLKLGSPEFLAPMYHNLFGIGVMTGALGLYVASVGLGIYIVRNTLEV